MNQLLPRQIAPEVVRLSQYFPAVGIVGPRQAGKTTLARMVVEAWERPVLFLDQEDPEHFASLRQPVVSQGFYVSRQDLQSQRYFVVAPVPPPFPLQQDVEVLGLEHLDRLFKN
ncbi:MAG: hypothetical protein JNK89_03000 [Saprospiraceae bacterium]|nr:hypothetical protein [Saprospiraceae bacterium]